MASVAHSHAFGPPSVFERRKTIARQRKSHANAASAPHVVLEFILDAARFLLPFPGPTAGALAEFARGFRGRVPHLGGGGARVCFRCFEVICVAVRLDWVVHCSRNMIRALVRS